MLLQFTFSNFTSFMEPVTLSMTEANITEFSSHLFRHPKDKLGLLPMAFIYGPNGGGKSNFLRAFTYLSDTVNDPIKRVPCFQKAKKTDKAPSTFDITFRVNDREYNYQLSLQGQEVLEETLFGRNLKETAFDVIFDRDREGIYLNPSIEPIDVAALNEDRTMLCFIKDKNPPQELADAIQWLSSLEIRCFEDFADNPSSFYQNSYKEAILKFFQEINIPLTDIKEKGEQLFLSYKKGLMLPIKEESRGLRALISMICYYYRAEKKRPLLLLDDLAGNLHPKALEHFLKFFTAKDRPYFLQCIAICNSMPLMHNHILRRDEIYLCDKDSREASGIYSLAAYTKKTGDKVRKDEVYYKQYLEGRYGSTLLL